MWGLDARLARDRRQGRGRGEIAGWFGGHRCAHGARAGGAQAPLLSLSAGEHLEHTSGCSTRAPREGGAVAADRHGCRGRGQAHRESACTIQRAGVGKVGDVDVSSATPHRSSGKKGRRRRGGHRTVSSGRALLAPSRDVDEPLNRRRPRREAEPARSARTAVKTIEEREAVVDDERSRRRPARRDRRRPPRRGRDRPRCKRMPKKKPRRGIPLVAGNRKKETDHRCGRLGDERSRGGPQECADTGVYEIHSRRR